MATQHQDSATKSTSALPADPPVPVQSTASSDIFAAAFAGPTNSTGLETHGPNVEEKDSASKSTPDPAAVSEVLLPHSEVADGDTASTDSSTITSCYTTASEGSIDSPRSADRATITHRSFDAARTRAADSAAIDTPRPGVATDNVDDDATAGTYPNAFSRRSNSSSCIDLASPVRQDTTTSDLPRTGTAGPSHALPEGLMAEVAATATCDNDLIAADGANRHKHNSGQALGAETTFATVSESDPHPPLCTKSTDNAAIVGSPGHRPNSTDPERLEQEIEDAKQRINSFATQEGSNAKILEAIRARTENFVKVENSKWKLLATSRKIWLKREMEEARARRILLKAEEALKKASPHTVPSNQTMLEQDQKYHTTNAKREGKARQTLSKADEALRKASAATVSAKELMDLAEQQHRSAVRCKVADYGSAENFRSYIRKRKTKRERDRAEAKERICEAEKALAALGYRKKKFRFC